MSTHDQNTTPTGSQISAVAIKLPQFWPKFPVGWFVRAEGMFRRSHPVITAEETKYDHVLAVLPEETIMSVYDVIENNTKYAQQYPSLRIENPDAPPPTPYTDLKEALIGRNTLSEKERLEQILSKETIGNRKPSEFYRHLKQLAGNSKIVNDELIKSLWLRSLTQQVQQSLITSGKTEVKDLTMLADLLCEVSGSQPSLFSVSNPSTSQENDRLSRLEKQISSLASSIEAMKVSRNSSRRFRSRSRKRDSTPGASKEGKLCWYHRKFKENAAKCIAPCDYKGN